MPDWFDRNGAGLLLAFTVDALMGEPPEALHPVSWMGKLIGLADQAVPGRRHGPVAERVSGSVVAIALPAGTFWAVRKLLQAVPDRIRPATEVMLLSLALAGHSLFQAARDVQRDLASGIDDGRAAVAHLVGRDTAELDGAGVTRAAIESVAENSNDGVIAPVFYGLIGGAPLAMTYKMINTLDSMIGYRDRDYKDFGWAAARLDDAAGFIPARLTGLAAALAGPAVGGRPGAAIATWRRDSRSHRSPNAGVCESAFAGALGICLGGSRSYKGKLVEGPLIGEGKRHPDSDDIGRAANLMYYSAGIMLVAGIFMRRCWRKGF